MKRASLFVVLICLALSVLASEAQALITHPGSYATLQDALNAAADGEEVRITNKGAYPGSLSIARGVLLTSVPAGSRIAGTLNVSGATTVTLRGLRIAPNAIANGVVLAASAKALVEDCSIYACLMGSTASSFPTAPNWFTFARGIHLTNGGALVVRNCSFDQNRQSAISAQGAADIRVSRCTFKGGVMGIGPGGLPNQDDWSDDWSDFRQYAAYLVFDSITRARVENCLFENGRQAIRIQGSPSVSVYHCTFVDPTPGAAVPRSVQAVMINNTAPSAPNVSLRGCVFYGWASMIFAASASSGVVTSDYNLAAQSTWVWHYNVMQGAHDLLNTDPLFVNVSAGDYHLLPASPAINSGDATLGISDYLGGHGRDAWPDRGCYEYMGYPDNAVHLVSNSTAYNTVQEAVDAAAATDEIRLTLPGTYSGNANLGSRNITMKNTGGSEARLVGSCTIGAGTVLLDRISFNPNTQANGITITGAGTVTINGGKISSCLGEGTSGGGWHEKGHSIAALSNATLNVTGAELDLAAGGVCGIYAGSGVRLTVDRTKIYNRANAWENSDDTPYRYRGNIVLEDNASADITNCLLLQGQHYVRMLGAARARFNHCTMWDVENGNVVAGIRMYNTTGQTMTAQVDNSIIGGGPWFGLFNSGTGTVNYTGDYNIIYLPRNAGYYSGVTGGTHDLTSQASNFPVFRDITNGDLRPRTMWASPAVGSANPASAVAADFAGNPRPRPAGTAPDRGCYEEQYSTAGAKYPTTLQGDYGLPLRQTTPQQLGLLSKQVLKMDFTDYPASRMDNYKGTNTYDELVMQMAMQGMINRSAPMVWLDNSIWGWSHGEATWQSYYHDTHGYTFVSIAYSLDACIRRLAPAFNGIILYDRTQNDNIFLALNLANLNFCIPVSEDLYDQYHDSFGALPVVVYLEKGIRTRNQTNDWMIANLLPLCDRTGFHSAGATFDDITLGYSWNNYCLGFDYAFYRKFFIANISCLGTPTVWGANPVTISGDATMANQFKSILAGLTKPAFMCGWLEPEYNWCKLTSEYGHYIAATPIGANLSFHGGVKPLNPPPYVQDTRTKKRIPENKIYLAFTTNEADNTVVLNQLYYRAWNDSKRGQIPLNWGIGPEYARFFPAMVEYLFRTKTANDYIVCPPSGAGYVYPMFLGTNADFFTQFTNQCMTTGVTERELGNWQSTDADMEPFALNIPSLRGITSLPDGTSGEYGRIAFTTKRHVPIIHYGNRMNYWISDTQFFQNGNLNAANFQTFLDQAYAAKSKPFYMPFYGLQDRVVGQLAGFRATLDPAKFEIVDFGTLMHLAGLPAGTIEWKPQHIQTLSVWSEKWNGAVATAGSSGLRLEIGAGKTWAVAAIPNLLLPENGTDVRVRVPSKSSGAAWAVKLSGDWDQTGAWVDWIPFGVNSTTGEQTTDLDPKVVFDMDRRPLAYLQMAVQGNPGDYVVFEFLDFAGYNLHVPSFTGAETLPVPAVEGTKLYVHTTGWFDADGDPENYKYAWRKNGVVIPGATQVTLPPANFQGGDSIRCAVTAWDGVHEGNTIQTTTVRVIKSAGVTDWNYP